MGQRAIASTFAVGTRYRCTLTIPTGVQSGCCIAEWEPHFPRRLSPLELADYRAGRDALLRRLAFTIGGTVAVVELRDGSPAAR